MHEKENTASDFVNDERIRYCRPVGEYLYMICLWFSMFVDTVMKYCLTVLWRNKIFFLVKKRFMIHSEYSG